MSRNGRAFALAITLIVGPADAPLAQDVARRPMSWHVARPRPAMERRPAGDRRRQNVVEQQRIAAIAHLAVFEAVNAITGRYKPYLEAVAATPGASAEAAAVAAAHAVLMHYVPEQAATLDSARASSLARIAEGPGQGCGYRDRPGRGDRDDRPPLERRLAAAGFHRPPSTDPGEWQLTPSCPPEGGPFLHLRNVVPFGIERSDQFRADPPPALTSRKYATDLNEVKAVGAAESPNRPADRADVARFYAAVLGLPTWNSAAQQVAVVAEAIAQRERPGVRPLNMALFDAVMSVFETKYHETFWRPETAIPAADVDDNPETDPNPAFKPFVTRRVTRAIHRRMPASAMRRARFSSACTAWGRIPSSWRVPAVPDVRLQYTASRRSPTTSTTRASTGGSTSASISRRAADRVASVGAYILRHHLRPARHDQHGTGPTGKMDPELFPPDPLGWITVEKGRRVALWNPVSLRRILKVANQKEITFSDYDAHHRDVRADYPVMSAPMALHCGGTLAAAVSKAGALGRLRRSPPAEGDGLATESAARSHPHDDGPSLRRGLHQ